MNHNIIRTTSLAFLYLFIMSSCTKNDFGQVKAIHATETSTISLTTAMDNLEEIINSISFKTRSMNLPEYASSNVYVFGRKNLVISTRSEDGLDIPDTLLYIVNFNENEGFAVLAGDKRIPSPVLCLTESGSLHENDFMNTIHYFQTGTKVIDSTTSEIGESYIPTLLLASVLSELNVKNEAGDRGREGGEGGGGEGGGGEGGGGEGNDIDYDSDYPFLSDWPPQGGVGVGVPDPLGPYVMTKWGQSEDPFNRNTPNHYLAGCASIALGQLLVANRFPSSMIIDNATMDWDEIGSVYSYQNYQSTLYNGSYEGKEQVASLIAELGSLLYMEYGPNGSQSNPYILGGRRARMRNAMMSLGFSVNMMLASSFTDSMKMKAYDLLRGGFPVIVMGYDDVKDKGHAWLIDGFRFVVGLDYSGSFFHINWGGFGVGDGYYNLGLFNFGNGVFYHSLYDDSVLFHPDETYDFNERFALYDYSLE